MQATNITLPNVAQDGREAIEVAAPWLKEHRADVRLIDVREPHELTGPLGAIEGAENIPMLSLMSRLQDFDANRPIVLICRSGRRSGEATRALREKGLENVVSVEGGMIAWNTEVLGKHTVLSEEKTANTENLCEAVYRTNGLPEVAAHWVAANIGRFRLIDIREANELATHGKVPQAEHIPMSTFMAKAQQLDRAAPLVVMCASGGRSGRVVRALEMAGFTAAASLEGGMFGWKASGLPAQ